MSNELLAAIKAGNFQAITKLNLSNPEAPGYIDVNAEGEFSEGLAEEGIIAIPLHVALYLNQTDAVKYLVQVGADVNKRDDLDDLPLEVYLRSKLVKSNLSDKLEMINFLFRAGAEVTNELIKDNVSACREILLEGYEAVAVESAEIAKALYSHRLFSKFMYQVATGNTEIVSQCLQSDYLLRDTCTPLVVCSVKIDPNTDGGVYGVPILEAARLESPSMLELLHRRGAILETVNENGYNALHFAARYNRIDNLRWLLTSMKAGGANINAMLSQQDHVNGLTPLQLAQRSGQSEAASFLLTMEVEQTLASMIDLVDRGSKTQSNGSEEVAHSFTLLQFLMEQNHAVLSGNAVNDDKKNVKVSSVLTQ